MYILIGRFTLIVRRLIILVLLSETLLPLISYKCEYALKAKSLHFLTIICFLPAF